MKTKIPLTSYLFQPFRYIAGEKSLLFGLIILLVLSFLSYLCRVVFRGSIGINFAQIDNPIPFLFYFYSIFVSWLTVSLIFYLTALILSGSVRLVDMAGTLALAKTPLILAALPGIIPATHLPINIDNSTDIQLIMNFIQDNIVWIILLIVVSIITIVWSIALMYNAFSVSGNLKGTKGTISFIIALLLSEICVFVLFFLLNPFI